MKRTERIETVEGLIKSIKDSLESWDAVEAEGDRVMAGCNVKRTDSRNSIINRCMIARSELLNIMNDLKGVLIWQNTTKSLKDSARSSW